MERRDQQQDDAQHNAGRLVLRFTFADEDGIAPDHKHQRDTEDEIGYFGAARITANNDVVDLKGKDKRYDGENNRDDFAALRKPQTVICGEHNSAS